MMIPQQLIFLDLETTGVNPLHDRIIEIGLCQVADGEPVGEWSTLVNPGKTFSPFIENLTGISNAMAAAAPPFADIAAEFLDLVDGRVLVAHNARFDYGFLKNEFARLGIAFREKVLCTVKLCRALFPKESRHNLDTVIQRHGLRVDDRHRALGDARIIRQLFSKLCAEIPAARLEAAVARQLKQPSLPPGLPPEQVEALPHAPGIYRFYGEGDTVLYVGKSVDIRSRVQTHFADDHRAHKEMRLSQQVRRIDCIETGGELGALLLEARLIKELIPIHNRRLRRSRDLFAVRLVAGGEGFLLPRIVALNGAEEDFENLYGMFRTRRDAEKNLLERVRENGLCEKVLGLEKGSGACFGYQIKKCRGACVGQEPPALHQARLILALSALRWKVWPFRGPVGIRERSPGGRATEIHVIDHWRHLGSADSEERLWAILAGGEPLPFDLDCYKILTRYLERKGRRFEVVDLSRLHSGVSPRLFARL